MSSVAACVRLEPRPPRDGCAAASGAYFWSAGRRLDRQVRKERPTWQLQL